MRPDDFRELLLRRRLILDGAMSTMIPGEASTGGAETLCLTDPQQILDIHRAYLDAGADILTTNSFLTANPTIAKESSRLARDICRMKEQMLVAASIGPLRPDLSESAMVETYILVILALIEGGADILLLETATNLRSVRAVLAAEATAARIFGRRTAVMLSVCPCREPGKLLSGESFEDLVSAAESSPTVVTLGINCSNGFRSLEENISILNSLTDRPLSIHPNAGIAPDFLSPEEFADCMASMIRRHPAIRVAGGCCRTTPAHISALRQSFPPED